MSAALEQKLEWLVQAGHAPLLKGILHGIEKEGLRVDCAGELALSDHPQALGSTLTHSHITTDYSEALLEFITPAFPTSSAALQFLRELHQFTYRKLDGELVWCASMPGHIPDEALIPIARYGRSNIGTMKHVYRVGLEHRYGKMMQTIAGIHYNFSLPDSFWEQYRRYCDSDDSLQGFRSDGYFTLIRNFRRFSWLLLYLFGASPALCKSFLKGKDHQLQALDAETLYLPYATSLRMSDLGYSNQAQASLNVCFNHLDTYAKSLEKAITTPYPAYEALGVKVDGRYRQLNSNILQIENEYYSDIRPKRVTQRGEKPIHALQRRGVEYVEVRNTDINPFLPLGIDQSEADFLDLFLIYCLLADDQDICTMECRHIQRNHQLVVTRGREPGLQLQRPDGAIGLQAWGFELLAQVAKVAEMMDQVHDCQRYSASLTAQQRKLSDPEQTPSARVLATLQEEQLSYNSFILRQSRRHSEQLMAQPLAPEREAYLEQLARASLDEQASIEAADTLSFDEYLAHYHAS